MKFDELGLPQDNGASDLQDSARLAGLMTVFNWPQRIDLEKYILSNVILSEKRYVRHPKEIKYDFSRDQTLCFIAGLYEIRRFDLVNKNYVDGKDLFSPSHMGHFAICQGKKPTLLQRAWLWLDVYYSCFYQPMGEPNQLLCMLMVYPDKSYLKFWLKHNKVWRDAIREYWYMGAGAWRGEEQLAEHMIKVLESR